MAESRHSRKFSRKPCILIVDDELDDAEATRVRFSGSADVIARTPDEVTLQDLRRGDLALVDFTLDDWNPTSLHVAEQPKDGVALVSVLRSHCGEDRSIAFALLSGRLDGLSRGLPPRSHLHKIARANNVEWVFAKSPRDNLFPLTEQALSLAAAMRDLPTDWPVQNPARMRKILEGLLALQARDWRDRAWGHVEGCHPPIHELSPPTHAVNLLRWLLHSILPYATFLWDYRFLAARLRVTPKSLKEALEQDPSFGRRLTPFRYSGLLHDFLGERWWRPGIEHWLWESTQARPFDAGVLEKLERRWSRRLESVSLKEPVVAFDEDLRATDELIEMSEAVELEPDHWPGFADRPYAKRDVVMLEPKLKSLLAETSEA